MRWIGVSLIGFGVLANERVLGRLLCADGEVSPVGFRAILLLLDLSLILLGGLIWAHSRSSVSSGFARFVLDQIKRRQLALRIALSVTSIVLTVAAVEGFFLLLSNLRDVPHVVGEGGFYHGFFEEDGALGYRPVAGTNVTARLIKDGKVVYDVKYTTDKCHRRSTQHGPSDRREWAALFFGCSYTFGVGVEDSETLPARFADYAKSYRVYNYGFGGYGPQQMLAKLEEGRLRREVDEPLGLVVFVHLQGNWQRLVGSRRVVSTWGEHMPYYRLSGGGEIYRAGEFRADRPFLTGVYRLLSRSPTLAYFDPELPVRRGAADLLLLAALYEKAADICRSQLECDEFYVLIYPASKRDDILMDRLAEQGTKYLDYTDLFIPEGAYGITGDGHPSPLAYDVLAKTLAAQVASE